MFLIDRYSRRTARMISFLSVCVVLLAAGVALLVSRFRSDAAAGRVRYDSFIWASARRHHLSPFLIKAVIQRESSFRARARGDAGEFGLMQITRGAVTEWERHTNRRCGLDGMLLDPGLNIEIGTWYLSRGFLHWREYRSRETLALAEYNAGRTPTKRWAPENPKDELSLEMISFPGTRQYIESVRKYRRTFEKEHRQREE